MKGRLFSLFLLIFYLSATGQNLVPNGDFEQYNSCPSNYWQFYNVDIWINPATNIPDTSGTPEYFHVCASYYLNGSPNLQGVPKNTWGYQPAHSGSAYSGIYLNFSFHEDYREYLESPLINPLLPNTFYHFEMYVSLADICKYTTDALGVYFSDTLISGVNNYLPLPVSPQIENPLFITDTAGWTLITGDYLASGGESYLVIGNFKNDSLTDMTTIIQPTGGSVIFIYIDDISLTQSTGIPENVNSNITNIFPNPAQGNFTIRLKNRSEKVKLKIYDVTGKTVLMKDYFDTQVLHIQLEAQAGIYFAEINFSSGLVDRKKICLQ